MEKITSPLFIAQYKLIMLLKVVIQMLSFFGFKISVKFCFLDLCQINKNSSLEFL